MENIIEIILYVIVGIMVITMIINGYKTYKSSKNDVEKAIYFFIGVALVIPCIIYILDIYNIPSSSKYTANIDKSDWINFSGTYFSTMFSTLISAAFLIQVTREQIKKTYKDNVKLNNENYRIQNLPFLQYDFGENEDNYNDLTKTRYMSSNQGSDYNELGFSINIKNIGLNAISKTYIKMESDCLNEMEIFELSGQSSIEKNKAKQINFLINSIKKGEYTFKITIFFQDLMKNWYEQQVQLFINTTDAMENSKRLCNKTLEVFEEKQMDKLPKELIEYIKNKRKIKT